ncbi:DNA-methyltransferase [Ancylobacter sp. SL191]|uniref:DNA-methyltransferase n=1 Tax=Ancylobacter sp. SL191 TaxID=2995166 RepID=UPI00226F8612|nr:site-specific DNA-methyltransferase [Ancylobacter sp. SL191]WAC27279.1 site-specific DNA-methyltransferase [Ancylobacter sp. SL191]
MHIEVIGNATLYYGDALDLLANVPDLSGGAILTDPPYSSGNSQRSNRDISTSRKYSFQKVKYPEFDGDSRDQRSYFAWSSQWLRQARRKVPPSALCCVFSDWRQLPTTTDAIQSAGWVWRGIVPWDKTECARPQRGRYRNQAEYAVWATNGPRALAGSSAPGVIRCRPPSPRLHMAGKPVELMSDLLQVMEGPILDPFMGSGTIGVACLRASLTYIGIESSREYFEIACQRIHLEHAIL